MLFLKNMVKSVHEFAENKLIIYNDPCILICHDWKVIHTIGEAIPGNKEKFWISKMPFFDLETLPFVVISGKEAYSLINVETGKIYPLVLGSACNTRAQNAAFFIEQESGCFDMNFCTLVANQQGMIESTWYTMSYKPDFIEVLRKYGRPPFGSIE